MYHKRSRCFPSPRCCYVAAFVEARAGMLQFMLRYRFSCFCFKAGMETTMCSLFMTPVNVPLSVHFSGFVLLHGSRWSTGLSFQAGVKGLLFSLTCSFVFLCVRNTHFVLLPSSAGFLGLREGPVQQRAAGLLHLCCSQSQKKEVKGEAAA